MGIYKPKGSSLVVSSAAAGGIAGAILGTQTSSLLSYYKCDDSSSQLIDSSANGNDLAEVGTGHSYGIAGLVGDAVNGNQTGGWNNDTGGAEFAGVMPGDNGLTICALLRPQTPLDIDRLFGFGSSGGNVQYYGAQQIIAGNRSLRNYTNAVSSTSTNISVTNAFPDTDWHFFAVRSLVAGIGGVDGPDDLHYFIDDDGGTKVDDTTWLTLPQISTLDQMCINSVVIAGSDTGGNYGTWDIQHVAMWNISLTDSELSDIAQAAGF